MSKKNTKNYTISHKNKKSSNICRTFYFIYLQNRIQYDCFTIVSKKLRFFPIALQPNLNPSTEPFPYRISPRPISDCQLNMLPCLHPSPIYLVVFKGSYVLTTGYLILRGASRLDAFSVYPCRTWLLCHRVGP